MNDQQRRAIYGPPCTSSLRRTRLLFEQNVQAHRLVADHLVRTCQAADRALLEAGVQHTRPRRMDSFNCRHIAGTDAWSLHAYGLAWDLFRTPPGVPPPGGVMTPDLRLHSVLIRVFERAGFTWGGRWSRPDQPHIEWSGAPPR